MHSVDEMSLKKHGSTKSWCGVVRGTTKPALPVQRLAGTTKNAVPFAGWARATRQKQQTHHQLPFHLNQLTIRSHGSSRYCETFYDSSGKIPWTIIIHTRRKKSTHAGLRILEPNALLRTGNSSPDSDAPHQLNPTYWFWFWFR